MCRSDTVIRDGNSQADGPADGLARQHAGSETDAQRGRDEAGIGPKRGLLAGVLQKFARFGNGFMAEGRGDEEQADRDALYSASQKSRSP